MLRFVKHENTLPLNQKSLTLLTRSNRPVIGFRSNRGVSGSP
jgi:hypothetical protein